MAILQGKRNVNKVFAVLFAMLKSGLRLYAGEKMKKQRKTAQNAEQHRKTPLT
jgi:hypothetical protein